jgi:hypothetical protein
MERGIYVGAGITAATGIVAYALMPVTGMVNTPTYIVSPFWLTLMIGVIGCHLLWQTMVLAIRGEDQPIAKLRSRFELKQAAVVCLGCIVLASNLSFFGMIKPQLGQLVDFTADPLLADLDHFLLGADAWRLLEWFDHPGMPLLYHWGWFVWLAIVIYYLLKQSASDEKDRLLISYVAMWSIFGPLVHLALPAAGPVFYEDLGLGNRFAELQQAPESQAVKAYLWNGYVSKTFNPAGGISAMPSLHLATMFWTIIVLRNARWWLAFAVAYTVYIFLGSIAIGWHYAVDGIAGGIGAVLCYALAGVRFADRLRAPNLFPRISAVAVAAENPPRQ